MRLILLAVCLAFIATMRLLESNGIVLFDNLIKVPQFSRYEITIGLFAISIFILLEGMVQLAKDRTKRMVGSLAKTQALGEAQEEINELVASSRSYAENVNLLEKKVKELKASLKKEKDKNINNIKLKNESFSHQFKGQIDLLNQFQEKGKFVDFMMRDITNFDDSKVGSVARYIHSGCSNILKGIYKVSPCYSGTEGDTVTFDKTYDAKKFNLSGNIPDKLPFEGKVVHRGWTSTKSTSNTDKKEEVIYPIQVEVA